jgi:hypothetical protein
MMQTIIQVCIWTILLFAYAKDAQGNFLTALWVLQNLCGVKGTELCWLPVLPGASTGREAGRPRVVWLIRSSEISGGWSSRLTE